MYYLSMLLENDYLRATAGGVLIGVAAVVLLWFNGRIAGISGITNGVFQKNRAEVGWRAAFIIGLVVGGLLFQWFAPVPLIARGDFPTWLTIAAGLLVGFGTRLGSGCTSGHGICGISRLSIRSIAATMTFVVVGMAIATLASRVLL